VNGNGSGDNTIILGDGNDDSVGTGSTGFTGQNDHITLGNGNRDVVAGDDGTVTMGNGNNDVFNATKFDAHGATVTLGNGNHDVVNDFVSGSPQVGNKTITVGNGNDTIYVGNSDTIQVGIGHDSFIFQQTTPGTVGAVAVAGFDPHKDSFTFSSQLTTSVSYHDNAQGNAVVAVDNNPADTITLVGVHAADLHPSDFHFADPAAVAADAHLAATAAAHAFLL
jgi:hypothetical protein